MTPILALTDNATGKVKQLLQEKQCSALRVFVPGERLLKEAMAAARTIAEAPGEAIQGVKGRHPGGDRLEV